MENKEMRGRDDKRRTFGIDAPYLEGDTLWRKC